MKWALFSLKKRWQDNNPQTGERKREEFILGAPGEKWRRNGLELQQEGLQADTSQVLEAVPEVQS